MNIQKGDLTLRGVKLNMEFVDGYVLKKIASECNNSFKEILGYEVLNICDDNNKLMTILFKRIVGVEYKIVLKSNYLGFHAKIKSYYNIENILSEIKRVITLFYDFVYKIQDCRFKIINIVFSKYIILPETEIKKYFALSNAIAEKGIGLYIERVQNEKFNVLLKSYFLNKTDENGFIDNIDKNLYRLYCISYK